MHKLIAPISINVNAEQQRNAIKKARMIREWFIHMMRKRLLWFVLDTRQPNHPHPHEHTHTTVRPNRKESMFAFFVYQMHLNANLLNQTGHWKELNWIFGIIFHANSHYKRDFLFPSHTHTHSMFFCLACNSFFKA